MERVLSLRSSLSSRAWQKVHLQPWLFRLVESYMAAVVLSATRTRVSLAHRLLGSMDSDSHDHPNATLRSALGTPGRLQPARSHSPRLAYLDAALSLLSRSVSDLPLSRLSAFDAESTRVRSGLDLIPQLLADRSLLAHERRDEPAPAPLASKLSRPVRVLLVVDPAPLVAPRPRVRNDRLVEPLLELAPQDRAALALAVAWRGAGEVHVCVAGVGTPAASSVLRECLALGADEAFLIGLGTRPVLAGDVAEFAANLIRLEEDLRGPFDVILGAERSAGLMLPLARRLDLEPVQGVVAAAVEADADALVVSARLARPETVVSLPGPALLLVSAETASAAARFGFSGWAASRAKPIRVLDFVPREGGTGRLVVANGARADAAAEAAPAGPLDPEAAAAAFAEVAQISAAAGATPREFGGDIVDLDAPGFLGRVAVVAIAPMDVAAGPSASTISAVRAASVLASRRSARAGAILLSSSEDEDAIRGFIGTLFAQAGEVDVGIVGLAELPLLTDRRLASLLESMFAGSPVSTVYSADLRGAGLMTAEGRIVGGQDLPFMDGIDRLDFSDGTVLLSGVRLEGRARYVLSRDASAPLQVLARGEIAVPNGAPPPSPSRTRPVVALLSGLSVTGGFSDDLSRALREARSELGVASLTDAEFIIDVGAGVGSRDGIEEVIDPLKAALERLGVRRVMIGASRKVTQDLALLPDSCQIGQTGVPVNPRVLLAIGISGAPQHLNYIGERGVIFAFNRDPEAPIMILNRSRPRPHVFPILGDLFTEVPRFIAALSSHTTPSPAHSPEPAARTS